MCKISSFALKHTHPAYYRARLGGPAIVTLCPFILVLLLSLYSFIAMLLLRNLEYYSNSPPRRCYRNNDVYPQFPPPFYPLILHATFACKDVQIMHRALEFFLLSRDHVYDSPLLWQGRTANWLVSIWADHETWISLGQPPLWLGNASLFRWGFFSSLRVKVSKRKDAFFSLPLILGLRFIFCLYIAVNYDVNCIKWFCILSFNTVIEAGLSSLLD